MSGSRRTIRRIAAGLCLAVALDAANAVQTHPRDRVEFYLAAYGELGSGDDPRVAWANGIFARVRAVADHNRNRLHRLTIVDSDGTPWAIALPDGHIVLSRRALDVCGRLKDRADACLAFVLGHELAHLADDDFWHKEIHGFLARQDGTLPTGAAAERQVQARELAADGKGYVYAAMAGYPVHRLLDLAGEDFFTYWLRSTGATSTRDTRQADLRLSVVRERLREIESRLAFFRAGVRLSHFDYCDDALWFFAEFAKAFPAREVLNNLGFCHLQIARQTMSPQRAYFYWLPLQLDGSTRGAALATRDTAFARSLVALAGSGDDEHLEYAVDYLEQAAQADRAYLPAQINLAVVYLYLGRPHQARAAIAEARRLAPERIDIRGLEAITLHEQSDGEIDLTRHAIQRLEALVDPADPAPALLFNLGRLYAIDRRDADAQRHWAELDGRSAPLPAPIRAALCGTRHDGDRDCAPPRAAAASDIPGDWPLATTGLTPLTPGMREQLAGWQRQPFDGLSDGLRGVIHVAPDGSAEVLEMDGYLQMQVIRGPRLGSPRRCNTAQAPRELATGEVQDCGNWAELRGHGGIDERWWLAD